jgi:hypothetical protein
MQIHIDGNTISFGQQASKAASYAAASALTKTAATAKVRIRGEMERVFDRPTPWILNSLLVTRATARKLEARVWFRDESPKRVAPERYMKAHVFGGGRPMKRSERNISSYLLPSEAAKKDQYGNVQPGQITKMLSNIGAQNDRYNNTPTGKRGGKFKYFAGKPRGGNRPEAVYFRSGASLVPVFFMQRKEPQYTKRLRFFEIVERTAADTFPKAFAAESQRLQWIDAGGR